MQYRVTDKEYDEVLKSRDPTGLGVERSSATYDDSHLDFWIGAGNATVCGIAFYLIVFSIWQTIG